MIPSIFPNSMEIITGTAPMPDGRVAIVTRTKDRPIMLARAITSLLAQTYRNWHMYVVNDGGDRACVDELMQHNTPALAGRFTVIHHDKNKGMEAATNSGILASQGAFVTVHDDDDTWHPTFLEETVGFLSNPENSKYAGVISHCELVYERIEPKGIIEENRNDWFSYPQIVEFREMLKRNLFPPICLVFRRSATARIGNYNESLPMLCDWDFHLRLLMIGDIGVVPKRLAFYHIRSNAGTSTYGNSVRAGADVHDHFRAVYQNSFLRDSFQKNPGALGVVSMLLLAVTNAEERVTSLAGQYNHATHMHLLDVKAKQQATEDLLQDMRRELNKLSAKLDSATEPPTRETADSGPAGLLWSMAFPLRRVIALLRGRI